MSGDAHREHDMDRLVGEYDFLRGEMVGRKLRGLPELPQDAARPKELAGAMEALSQTPPSRQAENPVKRAMGRPVVIPAGPEGRRMILAAVRAVGRDGGQETVAEELRCSTDTLQRWCTDNNVGWRALQREAVL
jgi:hypothetical protein